MSDNFDHDDDDTFRIEPNHMMTGHQLEEKFLLEGYLKKKSPRGLLKVWQERWFRLTTNGIYYYKKKESKEAQAHVPMYAIASIVCDPNSFKKKGFRFDITLADQFSGRVFSVTARTEQECLEWVKQLRDAQAAYDDHVAHFRKTNPMPDDTSSGKKKKIWKIDHTDTMKITTNQTEILPEDVTPDVMFSDYKIVADQSLSDFGSVFLIGGKDYPVTHKSFILHCIGKEQLHYVAGKEAMKELGDISQFPLFARQLHVGETSDAVVAIYHPPFRVHSDSVFAWLDYLKSFPEEVVCHLASQLILALEYLHSNNIVFVNLCPESLFFDMDGNLRILDTVLTLPPSMVPVMSVEYTCPENIAMAGSEGSPACDFWRLGILLYELSVGALPFPSFLGNVEEIDDNEHRKFILEQISTLDIKTVEFPPEISRDLVDLIMKLLVLDPSQRLTSFDALKAHPFFKSVHAWDINELVALEKPSWILESIVEPMLHDPQTPINLTPEPEDITTYRLHVNVKHVRGLPREYMSRLYCAIEVEGDIQKTKVINQTDTLVSEFNEKFRFDLTTGGTLPDSSDIVIELISKKLEAEGRSFIGSVSFPLNELHLHQSIHEVLTILGVDGLPIGELAVSFKWIQEVNSISSLLSKVTDPNKSFTETFLKLSPQPPSKLWSMIVDSSVIATAAQTEGDMTVQSQSSTNNVNALSKTNTMQVLQSQRKNPFVDASPMADHPEPEPSYTTSPSSPSYNVARTSTTLSSTTKFEHSVSHNTPSSTHLAQTIPEPTKLDPEQNPANWKTATDAQSGDVYYYNKVTKSTSWTPPPCLAD